MAAWMGEELGENGTCTCMAKSLCCPLRLAYNIVNWLYKIKKLSIQIGYTK